MKLTTVGTKINPRKIQYKLESKKIGELQRIVFSLYLQILIIYNGLNTVAPLNFLLSE